MEGEVRRTDVSEARRLKALEDEKGRLKRILAEAMLDNGRAEGSPGKKVVTPVARREAARYLRILNTRVCRQA
jgi:putative transposase